MNTHCSRPGADCLHCTHCMQKEGTPTTIAIIEDDAITRTMIKTMLEGFIVVEGACLDDLRRIIQEGSVDLILLDEFLPDGLGSFFLSQERKKVCPEIPVVMLTADESLGTAVECMAAGAAYYFTKPPNIILLNAMVASTIEMHRLRKQKEKDQKAREVAEAATHSMSEFVAVVSHELRSPHHIIGNLISFGIEAFGLPEEIEWTEDEVTEAFERFLLVFIAAQEAGQLEATLRKQLGEVLPLLCRAHKNNSDLVTLLNDLLDLAKIQSGQIEFTFTEEDLVDLFQRVTEDFDQLRASKNIAFTIALEEGFDSMVDVDAGKIMRVFINLLGNAAKFSFGGSTISANFSGDETTVTFSLKDGGAGIPEDELEKVFERFFQSSRTTSNTGGTGLGLAICQEIILQHSGRIWVENNPKGGAVFSIEIPRKQQQIVTVNA